MAHRTRPFDNLRKRRAEILKTQEILSRSIDENALRDGKKRLVKLAKASDFDRKSAIRIGTERIDTPDGAYLPCPELGPIVLKWRSTLDIRKLEHWSACVDAREHTGLPSYVRNRTQGPTLAAHLNYRRAAECQTDKMIKEINSLAITSRPIHTGKLYAAAPELPTMGYNAPVRWRPAAKSVWVEEGHKLHEVALASRRGMICKHFEVEMLRAELPSEREWAIMYAQQEQQQRATKAVDANADFFAAFA